MSVIRRPEPLRDSYRRVTRLGVVLGLFFGLAGCGASQDAAKAYTGPFFPVKGQVLLANGKPLTVGKVVFLSTKLGGTPATGALDSEGKFSLQSADSQEGAAPGDYRVRIDAPPEMNPMLKKKAKPLPFPASYLDEDGETGLKATVKAEPTQLEPFKLDAGKAGKASRVRD